MAWFLSIYSMKLWYFLCISFFSLSVVEAQTPIKPVATDVGKYGEVVSFSANLSEGSLTFTKTFLKTSSGIFQPTYTLLNPAYNNGKPMEVQLNRQAFDMYFKTTTLLSAAYNLMIKRSQDRNLSFNDEKGWTALMEYYNISLVK